MIREKQIDIIETDIKTGMRVMEEVNPRVYRGLTYRPAAEHLYEKGYRKQSEWVSIDERLPDEQGHFLIVNEEGKIITAFYTPRFGWFSGVRVRDITHWMPLPEAPKGGAE